jgi:hypothetical protein
MATNLLQQILGTKVNTSERLALLKEFTTFHEQTQNFVPAYGIELKTAVVEILVNDLQNNTFANNEEQSLILKTLRLLGREAEGIQPLLEHAAIHRIMELAGLSRCSSSLPSSSSPSLTSTSIEQKSTYCPDVEEEALKCLVNMALRHEGVSAVFVTLNGPAHLISRLQQLTSSSGTLETRLLFALTRLAVVLTTPHKGSPNPVSAALLSLGVLPVLVDLLHRTVSDSALFPLQCPLYLHEVLKTFFNVTIDMGPLGSGTLHYETYLPKFQFAVDVLLRILHEPNEGGANRTLHALKLSVVNCLINIPPKDVQVILKEPYKTIDSLLEVLAVQLQGVDERSDDAASELVTLLMLLTAIAGPHGVLSDSQLKTLSPHLQPREYLLKRLFPNRDLDREESEHEQLSVETKYKDTKTLGNQIIKHMTATNIGLKFYANELLFQICEENAERLVRLTGFGNAAGLLAMRNLFGMGAYLGHQDVPQQQPSPSSSINEGSQSDQKEGRDESKK